MFSYLKQFFGSSVHCCSLLNLSIGNSELIYGLYKKKKNKISYWHVLATLMMPLKEYSKLFDPELSSYRLSENVEAKNYLNIYRRICKLPRPKVDRLNSAKVRELQTLFIKRSFQDLLNVNITLRQADTLSYRNGLSLIIKDFLESCGCPHVPIHRNDLRSNLNEFVNQTLDIKNKPKTEKLIINIEDSEDGILSLYGPQFQKGALRIYLQISEFAMNKFVDKEVYRCTNKELKRMLLKVKELREQQTMSIVARIALEIHTLGIFFIIMKDSEGEHLDESVLKRGLDKMYRRYSKVIRN